jgi:hypothetical protein
MLCAHMYKQNCGFTLIDCSDRCPACSSGNYLFRCLPNLPHSEVAISVYSTGLAVSSLPGIFPQ